MPLPPPPSLSPLLRSHSYIGGRLDVFCVLFIVFSSSYLSAFLSIHLSGLLQHSSQDGANSSRQLNGNYMLLRIDESVLSSCVSIPLCCQICKLCICVQNVFLHILYKRINFTRLNNCLLSDHFFVFLYSAFFLP